jgi:hypothetical protein
MADKSTDAGMVGPFWVVEADGQAAIIALAVPLVSRIRNPSYLGFVNSISNDSAGLASFSAFEAGERAWLDGDWMF